MTSLGFASFDTKLYVGPIRDLTSVDCVLEAVELFRSTRDRAHAVNMLRQANLTGNYWSGISVKRLLSAIEMARQDPEAVAESLMSSVKELIA